MAVTAGFPPEAYPTLKGTTMAVAQQFPTKPLETFGLGKELQRQHAKHLWEIDKDRAEIMGLA